MQDNLILKYALQNAVKYKGKANSGAVIGKILQEQPGLKSKIKDNQERFNRAGLPAMFRNAKQAGERPAFILQN